MTGQKQRWAIFLWKQDLKVGLAETSLFHYLLLLESNQVPFYFSGNSFVQRILLPVSLMIAWAHLPIAAVVSEAVLEIPSKCWLLFDLLFKANKTVINHRNYLYLIQITPNYECSNSFHSQCKQTRYSPSTGRIRAACCNTGRRTRVRN